MIRGRAAAVLCAATVLAGCSGSGALDRLTDVKAGAAFTLDTGLIVRLADAEAPHATAARTAAGSAKARDALAKLVQG